MSRLFPGCARPAAVAAAVLLSCSTFAQTQFGTVVLTAQRQPQRIDQALAEVSVIDRAEIEAHAGRSLVELLAAQPGIQFWANGGLGKSGSISIRGLETRHTLVLIDGVRSGSATTGTPALDNLPLDAIERIEIVRGPLSGLYGSDAVGGVVQIFTRKGAQGLQTRVRLAAGSHGLRQAGAGLSFGAGPVDGAIGLQALRDDGFSSTNARVPVGSHHPDRDGFEQEALNARLGLKLGGDWRLDALGLHSRGESQIDDGPGADARARLTSQVASLQAGGTVQGSWHSQLRLARSKEGYNTLVSASPWTDLGEIRTQQTQLSWENRVATPLGQLLGVLERIEQEVHKPATNYTVTERRITGLALGLSGQKGAQHWQFSARRDRNSQFGTENTGSAAYGLDLNEHLRAGLALGSSFVAPSFNQLYWPGFGSPTLQPERGQHRELNARWQQGVHQVRAAWFLNRIRGYIPAGPRPANVPRAEIEGLSLSWEANWRGWGLNASLEALDPRNAATDKLLSRRAKDSLRLGLERQLGDWQLGAQLRSVGDRYDDAANKQVVKGHTVLDLRADWRLAKDLRLGLKLNNAADREYETVYGYNQPRREWLLSLRWGE
ncbi:vitamin B12 transporter [Inhella inkyongensis]|uniref:Vitamin B12 transporter n=1 Tax=Inhella inkyongensis TaxID=392593 RepID=A0A840S8I3_9BURK|nr:TonB-dependent receptor [Inhella inkyongensis]MBB5204851.1 vitamin B12 transporter [Inhella inkyongensis]